MDIVFCGTGWFPIVDRIRDRLPPGASIRIRDTSRPVTAEVAGADVILPSNCRIDAAAIAAAPRVRLIQQPAAGTEGIDLAAAAARGIPVCNVPGANSSSVAEAALFLILALARRLPAARRAFAAREIGAPLGIELRGKTLGIIGLGRSGTRLAEAAAGLGMRVRSIRSAATRAELLDLLGACDFASIHCPLTPATRGLFDDDAFAAMKPGAHVINCARGGIIDRAALARALASGRLGGAGLDVFWDEPWDPADPLYARDDVVVLPHVAGSTEEAFARIADTVAGNIRRLVTGEPLLHRL